MGSNRKIWCSWDRNHDMLTVYKLWSELDKDLVMPLKPRRDPPFD